MFRKNQRTLHSVLLLALAALACNLPGRMPPTITPTVQDTSTPAASETPTQVVEACVPQVTANTVANIRNGPGQAYAIIGSLPLGGTATVAGKNSDETWWYIDFMGGDGDHAWIAESVTTASCIPDSLAVIAAPAGPVTATNSQSNPAPGGDLTGPGDPGPSGGSAPAATATSPFIILLLPTIAPPMDIVPTGVITNYINREIYYSVQFVNDGGVTTNFEQKVWVDGSLVHSFVSPMPPSGTYNYTASFTPPIFGFNVVIKINVDTTNAIAESNEGNNELIVSCNLTTGC